MSVSIDKTRNFVYANGLPWEQALFSYLFDGGSLERLHQCLLCYKNPDGGWGHGLEHDIKCPDSHPLALEFLLTINRDTNMPLSGLLEGTVGWLERNRSKDGSLQNPDSLHQYPHAPWWSAGGQSAPDSITGNLIKLGICSTSLAESTSLWEKSMEKNYFTLFQFANTPDTEVAKAMPQELLNKFLDFLESSQREDGGWTDEHDLKHWQPYFSTFTLLVLKNYGRL